MILEIAILDIKPEVQSEFKHAFSQAEPIISSMKGYISHELKHCIENKNRYLLMVNWETLEDHTEGFRQSNEYQQWKKLLHRFYEPFPVVEHYKST